MGRRVVAHLWLWLLLSLPLVAANEPPVIAVEAGSVVNVPIRLPAGVDATLRENLQAPDGVALLNADPPTILRGKNGTTRILTLALSARLPAGRHELRYQASWTGGQDRQRIVLDIAPQHDWDIRFDRPPNWLVGEQEHRLSVRVLNMGNTSETLELTPRATADWDLRILPATSLEIPAGESRDVTMVVRPLRTVIARQESLSLSARSATRQVKRIALLVEHLPESGSARFVDRLMIPSVLSLNAEYTARDGRDPIVDFALNASGSRYWKPGERELERVQYWLALPTSTIDRDGYDQQRTGGLRIEARDVDLLAGDADFGWDPLLMPYLRAQGVRLALKDDGGAWVATAARTRLDDQGVDSLLQLGRVWDRGPHSWRAGFGSLRYSQARYDELAPHLLTAGYRYQPRDQLSAAVNTALGLGGEQLAYGAELDLHAEMLDDRLVLDLNAHYGSAYLTPRVNDSHGLFTGMHYRIDDRRTVSLTGYYRNNTPATAPDEPRTNSDQAFATASYSLRLDEQAYISAGIGYRQSTSDRDDTLFGSSDSETRQYYGQLSLSQALSSRARLQLTVRGGESRSTGDGASPFASASAFVSYQAAHGASYFADYRIEYDDNRDGIGPVTHMIQIGSEFAIGQNTGLILQTAVELRDSLYINRNDIAIDHRFTNGHRLGIATRNTITDQAHSYQASLSYSIPFGLPTIRDRQIGGVHGRVSRRLRSQVDALQGAVVRLGDYATVSDPQGHYAFHAIPVGHYPLAIDTRSTSGATIYHPDHQDSVTIAGAQMTDADIVVQSPRTIRVQVVMAELSDRERALLPAGGQVGLRGLVLEMRAPDGQVVRALTDRDGLAIFEAANDQVWTITAFPQLLPPAYAFADPTQTVDLSVPTTDTLTFTIRPRPNRIRSLE